MNNVLYLSLVGGFLLYFLPTIFFVFKKGFTFRKWGAQFAINLMWSWTIVGWFELMKITLTKKI